MLAEWEQRKVVIELGQKRCFLRGTEEDGGLPSGERDKELICNSGGGKTSMGEPGGQPDGSISHSSAAVADGG
jgi:hypothetical protein